MKKKEKVPRNIVGEGGGRWDENDVTKNETDETEKKTEYSVRESDRCAESEGNKEKWRKRK